MGKRLSDTAALTERGLTENQHTSVSIRKIANGYLVDKYSDGGCTTQFTKGPVRVIPARVVGVRDDLTSDSRLQTAVDFIDGQGMPR